MNENAQHKPSVSTSDVLLRVLEGASIVVDGGSRVVLFDSSAEKLLGLRSRDVLSLPAEVLPNPIREVIAESFRTGSAARNRLVRIECGAGKLVRVDASFLDLVSPRERFLLIRLNDMIALTEFERSIRRSNRLAGVGTLSASLAHEIKNALVAIKTFIEALGRQGPDKELAEIVRREIERINSIVGQMLKFSGVASDEFSRLRVHEVLDQSLRLLERQVQDRKVAVVRDFRAGADTVDGHIYHLEQAFVNLFLNAVAAMESGGELRVGTSVVPRNSVEERSELDPTRDWICLTIADTGCGIPPESIDRLFEPFFTTKAEGTGLGLPITRRIVHEHGGVIRVKSAPGAGTEFAIYLPIAQERPAA